jgi:hypothetical protein
VSDCIYISVTWWLQFLGCDENSCFNNHRSDELNDCPVDIKIIAKNSSSMQIVTWTGRIVRTVLCEWWSSRLNAIQMFRQGGWFHLFSVRELDNIKHARVSLPNPIHYLTDTSFREAGQVRSFARVVPDQTAVSAATFCRTLATQMR